MEAANPIIVKRVKKGGHGHHGGAWKVAFADFVTAMMAFFLLMWLMGSTTPQERAAIADYFENPSAIQGPGGASTSMIKHGAVDAEVASHKKSEEVKDEVKLKIIEREAAKDQQRLDALKTELEQAILQSDALKEFKDQLLLDITPEGLRIQIIDKENRAMFDSGSSHLKDYTSRILYEIAKIINKVPNKISLTGHTDATPYSSIRGYTNWELSTDRANASRRSLVMGGLDADKIAKVVGLSSTVLFDSDHPRSPVNRRISMIVMNKEAEASLLNSSNSQQIQSSQQAAELVTPELVTQSNNTGPTMLPLGNIPDVKPPVKANASPKPLQLPKGNTAPQQKSVPTPIQLPLKKTN
ncbi:MAG: flagellar motor protein MotB [Gammaproteobacteria bacterium]|jgi:chemotaxis protein MotB